MALALVLTGLGLFLGLVVPYGFIHFLGIDTQQSDNYDFFSGVGPVFVTAIGYGGLVTALVGKFNCHSKRCWRVGKHHVNGSPWCNSHVKDVRPLRAEHEILESIEAALKRIAEDSKLANDKAAELNEKILAALPERP